MNEVLVKLCEADIMLENLKKVNDNPHVVNGLYRKLLARAGSEVYASGVCVAFTLAVYDYCQGMPPMMNNLIMLQAPEMLSAMVTNDFDVTTDTYRNAVLDAWDAVNA